MSHVQMKKIAQWVLSLTLVLTVLLVGACSKTNGPGKPPSAAAPETALPASFSQIPADTPYLFGSINPLPAELLASAVKASAPNMADLEAALEDEIRRLPDTPQARVVRALMEELRGKLSREGLESLGFKVPPRFVLYGMGPIPVARIELKDPRAFLGLIERVEKRAEMKAPTAKIGSQSYWSVTIQDGTLIAAVVGEELVLSVMPSAVGAATLPYILGQKSVGRSLADTGEYQAMLKANGMQGILAGFIDISRILEGVLGTPEGVSGEIWRAMPFSQMSLPESCKKEFRGLVGHASRFEFGYVSFTGKRFVGRNILKSSPELTRIFREATAALPGMGTFHRDVAEVGIALKLKPLIDGLQRVITSINTTPFQCPELAFINAEAAQMGMGLAIGMAQVPPVVFSIDGIHARITEGSPFKNEGKDVKAHVIIGAKQPMELLKVLKGFLPALSQLSPKLNGPAVPVQRIPGLPVDQPISLAMSSESIGVAMGSGEAEKLVGRLKASSVKPPKFLVYSYDLNQFMGAMSSRLAEVAEKTDPSPSVRPKRPDTIKSSLADSKGFMHFAVHAEQGRFVMESIIEVE